LYLPSQCGIIITEKRKEERKMRVYVVYYENYAGMWLIGNVYFNRKEADEEAKKCEGFVLTRDVL
jgi:hypothetical protein